jgi:hypothetical protein
MSIEEISDRLEIQALLTRYTIAIDTHDWELLDTVFTPDAWIDYESSGGTKGNYPEGCFSRVRTGTALELSCPV